MMITTSTLRFINMSSLKVVPRFVSHWFSKCRSFVQDLVALRVRTFRRGQFRWVRGMVYFGFRLWLRRIRNPQKLPTQGPVIIVSNHTSYFDWAVLSAVYSNRYIVFLANQDLLRRKFVSWLMKLNILIYINPNKPGYSYFREVVGRLKQGHIVVIYPEGTRSRTGRMLRPKIGFVKLAMQTGVPVIPLAMKGAYKVLPPHKNWPRLKRCELIVGDPIDISLNNPALSDIFYGKKHLKEVTDHDLERVAIRIMDQIAKMAGQEWEDALLRRKVRK
ncbi:MAG: 1-acyl-sn-glycerol-3-phosphate acyltransferase [Candidatus Omnitrophica bacterium]|nr:1-acyl-sn-glycerol-3-phosphate acyltransferase [Candidatus Omnitrophota bacterium]